MRRNVDTKGGEIGGNRWKDVERKQRGFYNSKFRTLYMGKPREKKYVPVST